MLKHAWRGLCAAAFALSLALPVQASTPELLTDGITEAEFSETFESFDQLPELPERPSGAVNLESFDPPLEPEERETRTTGRSLGTGVASYYGRRFHGRRTANGERFNMRAMTAAHKTLPFGTKVRVTNPRNGKSVVVRINDRGPFIRGRTIDLSRGAAERIGIIRSGHGRVEMEIVS